MNNEKIIVEVNPRTKEKKTVNLTDLELSNGYTIGNLIADFKLLQKQVSLLYNINSKLINVVSNINKSTAVQIADIKEEIK